MKSCGNGTLRKVVKEVSLLHSTHLSDMEREGYQKRIDDLLDGLTNLRKNFGGFSSEKGGEVAAAWLTFIETCKLQKKAALDFFNGFFKSVTEGRSDYELIAQEVLG